MHRSQQTAEEFAYHPAYRDTKNTQILESAWFLVLVLFFAGSKHVALHSESNVEIRTREYYIILGVLYYIILP